MILFKKIFDWRNHPVRIFYILIPIVVLKFGFLLAYYIAQINVNNNWIPSILSVLGFIIFVLCVWPLRQIIRDNNALKQSNDTRKNIDNIQKN